MSKSLDVYYHGKLVGTLAETPDRLIAFQYSEEWIKTGFPISPFSLPLRNDVFIPEEKSRDRFGGLFGVFADSLPDAWGQLLLAKHLESLGVRQSDISTLDRLAYVGKNGMGALEYFPSKESDFYNDVAGLDFDSIAKECDNLLSSKLSNQLDTLYKLGASSGGTRPKILLKDDNKEWIVKFPAKTDPDISGKREYDYSLCAKACGIEMTQTQLIKSSVCAGYFKTERFDRVGNMKLHNITFAGLLEADFRAPSCDYRDYLKLTRVLTKDRFHDVEQMFKIMCFNIFTHNRDDHTKNFAFLYTEDKGWRLAPAYDLTYSETYWGEHTTSVNGKGKDIKKDDLITLGQEAGISIEHCLEYYLEIQERTKCLEKYFEGHGPKGNTHLPIRESISELSEP
ncbi:MAG: type II toxin-antitoxin system HipA family toxin [Lachnospiraceae bacterium]|nr:type II toxin-antitoxin system HipA family toxin [Lachnospiraceae bacterium]